MGGRQADPMMCLLALLCLLAAGPALGVGRYDPRGAYISLHAKWNSTPLLLEAAEFLVRGRRHPQEPSQVVRSRGCCGNDREGGDGYG